MTLLVYQRIHPLLIMLYDLQFHSVFVYFNLIIHPLSWVLISYYTFWCLILSICLIFPWISGCMKYKASFEGFSIIAMSIDCSKEQQQQNKFQHFCNATCRCDRSDSSRWCEHFCGVSKGQTQVMMAFR